MKKQENKVSQMGIWIDSRVADLILIQGKEPIFQIVKSDIEELHPKGGSRSKTPWGPMDKMDERKYLERKNHQFDHYFEEILDQVREIDEVYIFGPSEAKIGLEKYLANSHIFKGKILAVETADSMTKNEKIAKVKEFFEEFN